MSGCISDDGGTDRVYRTVVEGENPYKLAPGAHAEEPEGESSEDEETGAAAGTVYRLARGQLKRLDGGMDEYEAIAARAAVRLAQRKAT
jgi:ATP-binding cassette, subfamily F, member 3